jgi:hypothetical protein
VLYWDVHLLEWPSLREWTRTVRSTFDAMIASGAVVAWGGIEGHFADPPSLFDPKEMSGGIWAYETVDGEFECAELGQPFSAMPDTVLLKLRARAGFASNL